MTPERRRLVPGVRRGDAMLAGLDAQLDQLDLEIAGARRLAWRELAPKLRALGLNPGPEPRLPDPLEQRSTRHVLLDDPGEGRAQLHAAKRGRLVRSAGHVLRVR